MLFQIVAYYDIDLGRAFTICTQCEIAGILMFLSFIEIYMKINVVMLRRNPKANDQEEVLFLGGSYHSGLRVY